MTQGLRHQPADAGPSISRGFVHADHHARSCITVLHRLVDACQTVGGQWDVLPLRRQLPGENLPIQRSHSPTGVASNQRVNALYEEPFEIHLRAPKNQAENDFCRRNGRSTAGCHNSRHPGRSRGTRPRCRTCCAERQHVQDGQPRVGSIARERHIQFNLAGDVRQFGPRQYRPKPTRRVRDHGCCSVCH